MNNGIKVNFIVRKRNNSEFTDEQSRELGERIQALVKQLGYVIEVESENEPDTD